MVQFQYLLLSCVCFSFCDALKKKLAIFQITKLSLIKVFPTRESFDSDILAGDGKNANLFLQCRKYMSVRTQFIRKKKMTCLILVVGIEDSLQRIQTNETQARLGENIQRSFLASIASLVRPVFWSRLNSVYRSIHFSHPFGFHACVSHH